MLKYFICGSANLFNYFRKLFVGIHQNQTWIGPVTQQFHPKMYVQHKCTYKFSKEYKNDHGSTIPKSSKLETFMSIN